MGQSSSSNKISAQDRAILDMKTQRDKLQQYQKRITIITTRETEIAKQCLAENKKDKALLALRRKKYQESLLQRTDQQLAQLEVLVGDVEFALVQKSVVEGLRQGTEVLKQIHKEMGGLESVEKLMDDSREAQEYQKEISGMLAGQLANFEEDDVEDELAALEREVNGVKEDTVPVLPEAPTAELPKVKEDMAKERRERRAREARAAEEPMLA